MLSGRSSSSRNLLRSANAIGSQASQTSQRISKITPARSFDQPYPYKSSSQTTTESLRLERRLHTTRIPQVAESSSKARDLQGDGDAVPSFNMRLTPAAAKDPATIQAWLKSTFPTLPFPEDVAMQMVTHESWDNGVSAGHSRRLGFLGRRAMKFFLSLFLSSNAGRLSEASLSSEKINDLLHTAKLGDHVGRILRLEEVMRWTPAVSDGQRGPKETGLYKVRGVCVEALIGAIYHQYGAQAARSFFTSRILPHLGTFTQVEKEALREVMKDEAKNGEGFLRSLATNPTQVEEHVDVKATEKGTSSGHQESDMRGQEQNQGTNRVAGVVTMQTLDAESSDTLPRTSASPVRRRAKGSTSESGLTLEEDIKTGRSTHGVAFN